MKKYFPVPDAIPGKRGKEAGNQTKLYQFVGQADPKRPQKLKKLPNTKFDKMYEDNRQDTLPPSSAAPSTRIPPRAHQKASYTLNVLLKSPTDGAAKAIAR